MVHAFRSLRASFGAYFRENCSETPIVICCDDKDAQTVFSVHISLLQHLMRVNHVQVL